MRDSPEKSHILVTHPALEHTEHNTVKVLDSQTFMRLDLWELILEMTEALE